jgi:hypothetical protein
VQEAHRGAQEVPQSGRLRRVTHSVVATHSLPHPRAPLDAVLKSNACITRQRLARGADRATARTVSRSAGILVIALSPHWRLKRVTP